MAKCEFCWLHKITYALVFIGALNWGLIGVFDWNLVEAILGAWDVVVQVVYILVGVSAILMLFSCKCKACKIK